MPVPVLEPMLAANRQLTDGHRWAIEPKFDGWRALVYVDGGVKVRTRSGRNVTGSLPELAGIAEQVPDGTVLDGELVAGPGGQCRRCRGVEAARALLTGRDLVDVPARPQRHADRRS